MGKDNSWFRKECAEAMRMSDKNVTELGPLMASTKGYEYLQITYVGRRKKTLKWEK